MNVNLAIPVYVPAASLDAYKAAAGWKDFTNLQAPVTEFTVDNLKYKITDYIADEVELTGYATEPTGKLDIPADKYRKPGIQRMLRNYRSDYPCQRNQCWYLCVLWVFFTYASNHR